MLKSKLGIIYTFIFVTPCKININKHVHNYCSSELWILCGDLKYLDCEYVKIGNDLYELCNLLNTIDITKEYEGDITIFILYDNKLRCKSSLCAWYRIY